MALNRLVIEGTLKRIPDVWPLTDGTRRAIFTVRVPKDNGKGYDYIDCAAYDEVAESLKGADINQWVHMEGRLVTFLKGHKRCSMAILNWKQIPPPVGV